MLVARFARHDDHNISSVEELPWSAFVASLRTLADPSTPKADLPLWTPASYRNGYVSDANVIDVHGLAFDVDVSPVPSADDLRTLPLRCVAYSSSSATRDAPRWRLVFDLSRPVTAAEYKVLWRVVASMLPFAVGHQSKNPSRGWYVPRVGPDGYFEHIAVEGDPIDVDAALASAPVEAPAAPTPTAPAVVSIDARRAEAAGLIGRAWPPPGKRVEARLSLLGMCYRARWHRDDACRFAQEVHKHVVQRGDVTDSRLEVITDEVYTRGDADGTLYGWTELGRHIDPGIRDAARRLLDEDADEHRDFIESIRGATVAAVPSTTIVLASAVQGPPGAPGAPTGPTGSAGPAETLGERWGGWDVEIPPPVYLLAGLIPEHKVVTVFAEGGSVKTWAMLSLAIAVARGEPWLGRYPVKQGKALFLDWEDGPYEVARRVRMLTGGFDVPDLAYLYGGPQIDKPEFWKRLAAVCIAHGITCVVIDSLNASMPSDADENEAKFAAGLKLAGRFTEIGCTVVFVHHANKTGGLRGSSTIRDQSDVVFKFVPVDEDEDKGIKRMRMECDKPGPQRKPKPVNIELSDSGLCSFDDAPTEGAAAASPLAKVVSQRDSIKLALDRGPVATLTQLRERTRGNTHTFKSELDALIALKEVVLIPGQGYQLDDDARREARVRACLSRTNEVFRSCAKLAKAAHVSTDFVEALERTGQVNGSEVGRMQWRAT